MWAPCKTLAVLDRACARRCRRRHRSIRWAGQVACSRPGPASAPMAALLADAVAHGACRAVVGGWRRILPRRARGAGFGVRGLRELAGLPPRSSTAGLQPRRLASPAPAADHRLADDSRACARRTQRRAARGIVGTLGCGFPDAPSRRNQPPRRRARVATLVRALPQPGRWPRRWRVWLIMENSTRGGSVVAQDSNVLRSSRSLGRATTSITTAPWECHAAARARLFRRPELSACVSQHRRSLGPGAARAGSRRRGVRAVIASPSAPPTPTRCPAPYRADAPIACHRRPRACTLHPRLGAQRKTEIGRRRGGALQRLNLIAVAGALLAPRHRHRRYAAGAPVGFKRRHQRHAAARRRGWCENRSVIDHARFARCHSPRMLETLARHGAPAPQPPACVFGCGGDRDPQAPDDGRIAKRDRRSRGDHQRQPAFEDPQRIVEAIAAEPAPRPNAWSTARAGDHPRGGRGAGRRRRADRRQRPTSRTRKSSASACLSDLEQAKRARRLACKGEWPMMSLHDATRTRLPWCAGDRGRALRQRRYRYRARAQASSSPCAASASTADFVADAARRAPLRPWSMPPGAPARHDAGLPRWWWTTRRRALGTPAAAWRARFALP